MQLSLPMPKNRGLKAENEPISRAFITIDDVIQLAQELLARLNRLGEYKHPLGVRRGVRNMAQQAESQIIKAGGKTYFFDIKQTKEGKSYLLITESQFKGEGKSRERNQIIIFPEHASEFIQKTQEMIKRLN